MSAAWSASRWSRACSSPIPPPARPCSGCRPSSRSIPPPAKATAWSVRSRPFGISSSSCRCFCSRRTVAPSRSQTRAVSAGLAQLVRSVKDLVRHHGQVALFLLARMLYADGLGAVFAFGGIYAATVFGWGATELGLFGIVLTIAGTIGAVLGGLLDDRRGSKAVIAFTLLLFIAASIGVLSVDRGHILFVRAGRAEASRQRTVLVSRRAGLSRLRRADRARLRADPGLEPHPAGAHVPARARPPSSSASSRSPARSPRSPRRSPSAP